MLPRATLLACGATLRLAAPTVASVPGPTAGEPIHSESKSATAPTAAIAQRTFFVTPTPSRAKRPVPDVRVLTAGSTPRPCEKLVATAARDRRHRRKAEKPASTAATRRMTDAVNPGGGAGSRRRAASIARSSASLLVWPFWVFWLL